MAMQLSKIISFLSEIAPPALQEGYDNSGLIVGNPNWDIKKAVISLDCTEAVIDEAIEQGCNLVIAHHPIVFSGLKRFNGSNYVERTIIKAIKNDIAIYAIHTNLDNVLHGVNKRIAERLGLKNCAILLPKQGTLQKLTTFVPTDQVEKVKTALFNAGAGNIGNYDQCSFALEGTGTFRPNDAANPYVGATGTTQREKETRIEVLIPSYKTSGILQALFAAHPYEEVAYYLQPLQNANQEIGSGMIGQMEKPLPFTDFVTHLKSSMQLHTVKATKPVTEYVQSVAVCGGSGSFLLEKAKAAKADVFITADFKYHDYFDADGEITILDIGHYESERFTIDLLFDFLSENFPNFALLKTEVETNPVNYL